MRYYLTLCCALSALCILGTSTLKGESVGPINMGSLAIFLSDEEVRDSLHLSASQRQQLDTIRANFRAQARALVKNTPSNDSGVIAKSDSKLTSLLKSSNREAYQVLNKQQQSEVLKLEAKTLGGSLLLSEAVQNKLGLTSIQKAKITSIHASYNPSRDNVRALYHQGKIGHFRKVAKLRKIRKQEASKLLKVLTPAQHAAFKQLGS